MNQFDLATLLRYYSARKGILCLGGIIGALLGIIVAFSIPKTYTSKMSLAIESQRDLKPGGGMSALASMAGVNLGDAGGDAISPELYPDVVSTNKFLVALLHTPVKTVEGKSYKSYIDYTQTEGRSTWWSSALKGAIGGVKSLFGAKPQPLQFPEKNIDPNRLTVEEEAVVKQIRAEINCIADKETNVITLSANAQDPLVAKMMTDAARIRLQDFITQYRTNKARTDYLYYASLEKQLRAKYQTAQRKFSAYADSHQDLELKSYETKMTDLENEMQNAFNAYTQMKQQVQMTEAKIQERTPVFTTVEDAYVPNKATAPKKALILIAFLMVGVLGTTALLYVRLLFGSKYKTLDRTAVTAR